MDAQQADDQNEQQAQLAQLALAIDNIPDNVFAEIDFMIGALYQINNFELAAIPTRNDVE